MDELPRNHPLQISNHSYDKYVYTWKIATISSIAHVVDHVVQSPSFLFNGATWILKMYPYGQTVYKSEGFVDVTIEQKGLKDDVACKIYCKDVFDKEISSKERGIWKSDSKREVRNFIQNIKDHPEKWKIAPDDTFTLVCEFTKTRDTEEKSACYASVGKKRKLNSNKGNLEVGEIFEECFESVSDMWKICDINCTASVFPNDYKLQSTQFSLAKATWVLKVYPYFKMVSSNPSFDVQLERLESEIPEHSIVLKIGPSELVQRTLFFNACHTQGDRINFHQEEIPRCLHLSFVIQCRRNLEDEFRCQPPVDGNIAGSAMTLQHNKVLQDLKDLYLKQEDCDVLIKVKGQEFPAHRVILKARSPVLASAFRSDMKEKATGILDIEDCDPSSFSDFLCFIYCGEIKNLSEKNAFSLFTAADKYDVPDLRAMCMEFIKQNLSVENFCDTIALALLHSEKELIDISTDFFQKNLQEIIVTVKWQSFVIENPIHGNELMIKALVPSKKGKIDLK